MKSLIVAILLATSVAAMALNDTVGRDSATPKNPNDRKYYKMLNRVFENSAKQDGIWVRDLESQNEIKIGSDLEFAATPPEPIERKVSENNTSAPVAELGDSFKEKAKVLDRKRKDSENKTNRPDPAVSETRGLWDFLGPVFAKFKQLACPNKRESVLPPLLSNSSSNASFGLAGEPLYASNEESEPLHESLANQIRELSESMGKFVETGELDLLRLLDFKRRVKNIASQFDRSDLSLKTAKDVQKLLDVLKTHMGILYKAAEWLCSSTSQNPQLCAHFYFSTYLIEVNYLNMKAETLLLEVLFSSSPNEVNRAGVRDLKTIYENLDSVDTQAWRDIKELSGLHKLLKDIREMLTNSEFLVNKKAAEISDADDSDYDKVISDPGNP